MAEIKSTLDLVIRFKPFQGDLLILKPLQQSPNAGLNLLIFLRLFLFRA